MSHLVSLAFDRARPETEWNQPWTAILISLLVSGPVSGQAAEIDATWTGDGGTSSYSHALNWDVETVPINNDTQQYNVTVPSGTSVVFDLDGDHDVTDLTLGIGSTLTVSPGERLQVLDDARISGYVVTSGGTFDAASAGAQFQDEQARLAVSGAGTITVAASEYNSTWQNNQANLALLSADGAGSRLDLSSVVSFRSPSWSGGTRHYDVLASNGGVVDLSSLGSITGALNGHDEWLRFRLDSGGQIDLSSLRSTIQRTWFDIHVPDYILPQLETTGNTWFTVGAGFTVDLPELISISGVGGGITVESGAMLKAPKLISINNASLSINEGGTLDLPNLAGLTRSSLDLRPNQTFNHGVITDLDHSEIRVLDGATLTLDAVTSYTNTHENNQASLVLLSAEGTGSRLDLSSVETFSSPSWSSGTRYYDVLASNGGVVDLSSLGSITGALNGHDEWLRFRLDSGGQIDLSSLRSTIQRTWFDVHVPDYVLPQLETTGNTWFTVGAGFTVDLPELISMSGVGGGITVESGATMRAPKLFHIDNASLSIDEGGTLDLPNLTGLTRSSLTLQPNQTFNHGVITDLDHSEIRVLDGATLTLDAVTSYTNTLANNQANLILLSAEGDGARLDLSSVETFSSPSWSGGTRYYDVLASNGGVIDLSSLQSITGALIGHDEWLRFVVDTGGQIDLSALREINNRVRFDVNGDGVLTLGDVAITSVTQLNINHPDTDIQVNGSLYLAAESELNMAGGAVIGIRDDLLFEYTEETRLGTDDAIVDLNGSGIQFLEAGSHDLGLGGSNSGNFGIGRLVVGQEDQPPTTVMVLDLFDNGNRDGGAREALYLYGVGGLDGLELTDGSTLVLNDINVYARIEDVWVHLNELFDPGERTLDFAGGVIAVPEPSTPRMLSGAVLLLLVVRLRHAGHGRRSSPANDA